MPVVFQVSVVFARVGGCPVKDKSENESAFQSWMLETNRGGGGGGPDYMNGVYRCPVMSSSEYTENKMVKQTVLQNAM